MRIRHTNQYTKGNAEISDLNSLDITLKNYAEKNKIQKKRKILALIFIAEQYHNCSSVDMVNVGIAYSVQQHNCERSIAFIQKLHKLEINID